MIKFFSGMVAFKGDRRGVTAIEYGLIAALISLLLVAGATTAGGKLTTIFTNIGADL